MKREDAEYYVEFIDRRLQDDLNLYMLAIEKFDSEQMAKCKEVLEIVEDGRSVELYEIWDEKNLVNSILNLNNEYQKLLSRLPEGLKRELMEHIQSLISDYFGTEQ